MAYIAQVPSDLLTLDANLWVIDTNEQHLLNGFFSDSTETTGDISATNQGGDGSVAEQGETVTVPTAGGDIAGEYIGAVTLSTAAVTIGIPALAGIDVQLNDIEGHAIRADDGSTYIVSDQELDEDHLGATVSVSVLGQDIELIDVPLSEINETLASSIDAIADDLGPLLGAPFSAVATALRAGADIGQTALDLVTLNVAEGDGSLAVVCFARGTLIGTPEGPVPVEALKLGDKVITRDNGAQEIRWVGSIKLGMLQLMAKPHLKPIRISAGALGENTPSQDLIVSPQHRVLLKSKVAVKMFGAEEVLVAAKQLLQADGVDVIEDAKEVEYFHFLLDRHEVVISNGAATESLYTGPEALKSVGRAAQVEIFGLFPALKDPNHVADAARPLLSGRMGRKLVVRQVRNNRALVSQ